jgi:transcriptional regulator with XRE-family HTH domain
MTEPFALPRRYTQAEAAGKLGLTVPTLQRLERQGHIKAFRPSPRKVYYLESVLIAYMEAPKPWDRKTTSESASTSSASGPTAQSIAHVGTTAPLDRQSAYLSASETFRKRS